VSLRRTLLKYYAYRPTTFPGFTWPVLTLYLLAQGFSYTALALGGTAMIAAKIAGEVPSGYLADRIGRRNTCVASAGGFLLGQAGYLVADTLTVLVAVSVCLGLAESLQSGTLDAYLYDVLAAHGAEDRYTHVRGRAGAVRRWGGAGMMLAAGPLYLLDHAYPFYGMIGVNVASNHLLLTLPHATPTDDEPFDLAAAAQAVGRLRVPGVRVVVLLGALAAALTRASGAYIQPIAVETLDPYVALVPADVPPVATLGVVYAAFTVTGAVASDRAEAVEDALGTERAVVLLPIATGVALLVPAVVPVLAVPAFFVMKTLAPVQATVRGRYLNDRVASVGRATVLSAASLVSSVAVFPFVLAGGVVADAYGPFVAVAGVAAACLVGVMALLVVETPSAGPPPAAAPAD
jgi:MFS family permease